MSMMRRRLLDDTVRRTAEGEAMAVRSVARMRPGLSIYGKSQQKTTTGAQLLNKSASGQSRGVSWQIDGSKVTFEGTTNDNGGARVYAQVSMLPDMEIGKTYYAKSFTDVITAQFEVVKSSGNDCTDAVTLDGTETRINFRAIVDGSGGQNGMEVNLTAYVAVTENKNMTQWEPYTGGQPSPNPDYPQEIVSVGDDGEIGVNVYGGNFVLNPEEVVHFEGNIGDGVNSIGLSKFIAIAVEEQLLKNDISFSFDSDGGSESNFSLFIRIKYGTEYKYLQTSISFKIINGRNIAEISKSVFTNLIVTGVDEITVQIRPSNPLIDDVNFNITNLMLSIGSTALPFEPYKQPQSLIVSTPNGLPGIPVSSGGNYTDENGQQWISDEIDFKRGKYVQRVKVLTLTGASSEVWNKSANQSVNVFALSVENEYINHTPLLCTRFSYDGHIAGKIGYVWLAQDKNRIGFGYSDRSVDETTQDFRNFLSQNPVKLYYVLATPIETDLTPEQITAYQSLHTNYPTTTVMNDEGAGMKLTYKTRKSLEVT